MKKTEWIFLLTFTAQFLGIFSGSLFAKFYQYDEQPTHFDAVFVSQFGSDENDGLTPLSPLKSFEDALLLAVQMRVRELRLSGDFELSSPRYSYTANSRFFTATNLSVIGGFDPFFFGNFGNGPSTLSAEGISESAFILIDCSFVTLTNLVISGGVASYEFGGGIYVFSGSKNSFYVTLSNCSATYGGAVAVSNSRSNFFNCNIISNFSSIEGGGYHFMSSDFNTIEGIVKNNATETNAENFGGGIFLKNSSLNLIDAKLSSNLSGSGGGIAFRNSFTNAVTSDFFNNEAIFDGGGIFLSNGSRNQFYGSIVSNRAAAGGGAFFYQTGFSEFSGDFSANDAVIGGGAFFCLSSSNQISSRFINNNADEEGGGLFLILSDSNRISSEITENAAVLGGGVYLAASEFNRFIGTISSNIAQSGGGIAEDELCFLNSTAAASFFENFPDKTAAMDTKSFYRIGKLYGVFEE